MIEAKAHIFEVALAYAGSLSALGLLIGVTLLQARRARRELEKFEGRDG